ncbi:MAG: phosphatase PAP2 family protein [Rhodocyclaceae bacterium]
MPVVTPRPAGDAPATLAHAPTADIDRWLRTQAWVLALSAVFLATVFQSGTLDLALARVWFDPVSGGFPLRGAFVTQAILHDGAKKVSIALALATLVPAVRGMRGRIEWLRPGPAWTVALGMLLIPLATSVLKALTHRHCPWDVIDFGGYAPYVPLLALPPAGLPDGACFPAGHASVGFLWLAWAAALRPANRRLARIAFIVAATAGLLLGGVQMMRGAHFLSHVLWSFWLAWAISLALSWLTSATHTRLSRSPHGDRRPPLRSRYTAPVGD